MKRINLVIALLAGVMILLSFDIPNGWHRAGNSYKKYDMGTDKEVVKDGKSAATIKSLKKHINGFGTLMQTSLPGKYLGKRVRVTGYMKSENVKDWAGFWFRVDQGADKRLAFDNMQNRPVKGTTDWKKYEIVLDVPVSASNLAYGALLSGTGQIWFDDMRFEIVDSTVATTGGMFSSLPEPQNLNFEQ